MSQTPPHTSGQLTFGCHWLRQCHTIIRECKAIVPSGHRLVLELKRVERRAETTIRKAVAYKALAAASGTGGVSPKPQSAIRVLETLGYV